MQLKLFHAVFRIFIKIRCLNDKIQFFNNPRTSFRFSLDINFTLASNVTFYGTLRLCKFEDCLCTNETIKEERQKIYNFCKIKFQSKPIEIYYYQRNNLISSEFKTQINRLTSSQRNSGIKIYFTIKKAL